MKRLFILIFSCIIFDLARQDKLISVDRLPYQLLLNKNGEDICGAVLINKTIALTAAHCVEDTEEKYVLKGGTSFRNKLAYLYPPIEMPVNQVFIHENYNAKTLDYDIAVLSFKKQFPDDGSYVIKPIKLSERHPRPGDHLEVAGWGSKKGFKDALDSNFITVEKNPTCDELGEQFKISEWKVCARGISEAIYPGDAGGPVFVDIPDLGVQILFGVISHTTGCCKNITTFTSIYTLKKLASQIAEIDTKIKLF